MKRRNNLTKEQWSAHVHNWEISGLSQNEYCRQNDLSKDTFSNWKRRFLKQANLFVQIKPKKVIHQSKMKVIINETLKIEVEPGYDPDQLKSLVNLLRSM
jgi:hypothetical protein